LTADAYTAVYCLTAAMFFLECTIGPSWAVPMDVGGKYSGTVSGMMNMAGNIGGALSPLVFGVLAQLGSWAAHSRDSGSARRGFRGLGILDGPRRLGRRAIQTPDHSRRRRWLTRRRMSLVGPNWSSFSFVTRRVPEADIPSLYGINSSALASSFGESPPSACPPFRLDVLIGSSRGRTLRFAGGGRCHRTCGGHVWWRRCGLASRRLRAAAISELHGVKLDARDNCPGLRMVLNFPV